MITVKLALVSFDLRFYGGAERWVIGFCKYVKEIYGDGVEIDVYSVGGRGVPHRVSREFIERELVGVAKVHWLKSVSVKGFNFLDQRVVVKLFTALRKHDAIYALDVHLNVLLALLFLYRIYKKRVVMGLHEPLFIELLRHGSKALVENISVLRRIVFDLNHRIVKKFLLLRLPVIHVLNRAQARNLIELGYGGEIRYVPNFYLLENMRREVKSSPEFTCLFVGRLEDVYRKGLDLLSEIIEEALARNRGVKFYVIGSGENQCIVEDLARKYPENVKFLGFVSDEELVEHYSKASLFTLTSRIESFVLVALEAIFNGVPVVAFSGSGGHEEILNEEQLFGRLVPAYDIGKYVEAILYYYNAWTSDPNKYFEMRKKISKLAEQKYSKDVVIPKLMEVLRGSTNESHCEKRS